MVIIFNKFNIKKTIIDYLFIVLLLIGVFSISYNYQSQYSKSESVIDSKSWNEDVYKILSFGFQNLLSDYYWLSTVQYIGGQVLDRDYKYLGNYFNTVSNLDPKFVYPYKVNLFILSSYDIDESIRIAKKGMYYNYDSWSIPYYLGYLYGFILEDVNLGAAYFDLAKTKPNVLKSAHYLGPALRRNAGQYETTLLFWQSVLAETNDPEDLKKAKIEIQRINNMIVLKDACLSYYEKYDKHVDFYMNDLITSGLMDELPEDLDSGLQYGWYKNEEIIKILPILK